MKLIHLSDLHLGYRQYQRQTPAGINQREADVSTVFRRAIDQIIEIRPDFILVAGDVFHVVRPSNPAILDAFIQFSRLTQMLPDTHVVMVAGNHDTPRTAETGCILKLFKQIGIHVVDSAEQRLRFEEHDLSILAVPDIPSGLPALTPDPNSKYNVLLIHGEVAGIIPDYAKAAERTSVEITAADLNAGNWDYIALGHYHVYRKVADNAYYSGSIEYTSSNVWGELGEERTAKISGKGFIERDLVTGGHKFHALQPARPLIDLPQLRATGMNAEELSAAIAQVVESCPGGVDNKIVRLVARDVSRHVMRNVDTKPLREFRKRALHFQLDTRRPEVVPKQGQGSPSRRISLADTVRQKLEMRPLESGLDRKRLIELGLYYLSQTEQHEATSAAVAISSGEGVVTE